MKATIDWTGNASFKATSGSWTVHRTTAARTWVRARWKCC